jgi:two-component system CheB/CheR fusion protein
LRESVIFARHNVALDPPFPHIDLISLRNTLIYLNESLHDRVLAYCHFALSPGGLLFLGDSERPSRPPGLFEPVDDQHRIYRRSASGAAAALTFPPPEPEPAPTRRTSSLAPLSDQRTVLRDALVDRFIPPSLVVDGNDDVIEVNGDVSPWCWVAPGQPSTQALALVREELRPAIRSLLIQIRHGGPDPGMRGVASPDGETRIEARRLGPVESRWVLLSFSSVPTSADMPTSVGVPDSSDDFEEPELLQVRQELGYTRLALQSTISDVSAANEELRAMNEELQASAEELQASSEEVQAANEELQATNEELTTLNQELRVRSADLTEVNKRMEQIQGSLVSGMVVVDRQLRVVSFTPLAVRLFALIDRDLGRPLTEIGTTIAVPNLERHLHASLDQKANAMLVLSDRNHHFLVQFQPYLQEAQVAGVIVVVTEVTEVIQARDSATPATDLTTIVDSLREVVWRSDSDGRLLFINASVEQVYGLRRDDVLSDPGLLAAAVHPDDRARVASAPIQGGHRAQDYRIVRADGAVRLVRESAFTLASEGDLSGSTIVTVLDITGT